MHNLRKGQQLQHPKAQHTKKETAFKTDSADQSSYTTQITMLLLCRDKKSNLKKVELCQNKSTELRQYSQNFYARKLGHKRPETTKTDYADTA